MAEYIEKWSIVNRLIDIENEFQQYKPFHGFEHAMYRKICEAEIAIGKTQAADVAPVRHARWADNHCTACGMMPMGDEMWKHLDLEPPRFERFMDYCPSCGCRMDG